VYSRVSLRSVVIVFLGVAFSFLVGCTQFHDQKLDPKTIYRYDLPITVNGISNSNGHVVAEKARKYAIEVRSVTKAEIITLTSCHRHLVFEKPKKVFKYVYRPAKGIEDIGACPVTLRALDRKGGRHGFAFLDFLNNAHYIAGHLKCNGVDMWHKGVSSCQTKAGLIIDIGFPVRMVASSECEIERVGKKFRIYAEKGMCMYLFKEFGRSKLHRLTVLGYEDIILEAD